MQYLLDTNTFIEAKNTYYGFHFCPGFWSWIRLKNGEKIIYTTDRVKKELLVGNDDLKVWTQSCSSSLFLGAPHDLSSSLRTVSEWVANNSYTLAAQNVFFSSADYFVIAYAHALHETTVVTRETSNPNSKNRVKIPDVCHGVDVPCIDPFQLMGSQGAMLEQRHN